MQAGAEEIVAVRQEILQLLRQQMEALDSPVGLTDVRLSQCYERQARVHELREKLEALSGSEHEKGAARVAVPDTPSCAGAVPLPTIDTAANV
jgi:hypothetical protein